MARCRWCRQEQIVLARIGRRIPGCRRATIGAGLPDHSLKGIRHINVVVAVYCQWVKAGRRLVRRRHEQCGFLGFGIDLPYLPRVEIGDQYALRGLLIDEPDQVGVRPPDGKMLDKLAIGREDEQRSP